MSNDPQSGLCCLSSIFDGTEYGEWYRLLPCDRVEILSIAHQITLPLYGAPVEIVVRGELQRLCELQRAKAQAQFDDDGGALCGLHQSEGKRKHPPDIH